MIITTLILTVYFYSKWAWLKNLHCFSNLVCLICCTVGAKNFRIAQLYSIRIINYKTVWKAPNVNVKLSDLFLLDYTQHWWPKKVVILWTNVGALQGDNKLTSALQVIWVMRQRPSSEVRFLRNCMEPCGQKAAGLSVCIMDSLYLSNLHFILNL